MTEERTHTILGRTFKQSDLFKLGGLLAFFLISIGIVAAIWPSLSVIFEEDGVNRFISDVQNAGPAGVLMLLGLQFLQIVVAFIPGEVVQVAAGVLYGPWGGAAIILLGAVISSSVIYVLVHRLGAPFVQSMVGEKQMAKFRSFEETGKLNSIVFILFLIPGFPKDALTYIVPLSDMKFKTFIMLSTLGRTPGVVVSVYAASGFMTGDYVTSIVLFAVLALIAIIVVVNMERITDFINKEKE